MLCDAALENPFVDRYLGPKAMLMIDEYNCVVEAFCNHLSEIGRSPQTIDNYQRYVMRFLEHVEKHGVVQLTDISVELLYSYVATQSGRNRSTVKSTLDPVRIFLKYLYLNEYIPQDISQFVVSFSVRTQIRIPSVWTKEEVLKLLAAIDRGNPSGKRDYAIILLVARLGIRVGDVNNLKFENIDWQKNCVQSKTHNLIVRPLLKDVGGQSSIMCKTDGPKLIPRIFFLPTSPLINATLTKIIFTLR